MRKLLLTILAGVAVSGFYGCKCFDTEPKNVDTITQISTIDALLAGVYDGTVTLSKLSSYGNTGIGTFDGLDGEMIMIGGKIYQVKSDGKVYNPKLTVKTPFACVVNFKAEKNIIFTRPCTYSSFKTKMDTHLPNRNLMTAIAVSGTFKRMKTRSVPKQKKPYPPLKEVAKKQPVFEMKNVKGFIVGFRLPAYVKGINVPGYHLHFLSSDHKSGGHILDFEMTSGTVAADICDKFFMILPKDDKGFAGANLTKDRSKELHKVEQ